MGRKAQEKKKRKMMGITGVNLHNLRHDAQPVIYQNVNNGSDILLNPLKHLMKGEAYKDPTGLMVTIQMMNQYSKYMNSIKKKAGN